MSSRTTIDPLSITDGKISNQAKINPKKVAPADEASFLITQSDRKYQPKKIHGDGTIDADGRLTISAVTSTVISASEEETLPLNSFKVGPANHGDTENRTQNVGEGPDAIPKRDSSGNLKAETADLATNATTADSATTAITATTATNADKLDNQEGSHYLDVSNHTGQTAYEYESTTSSQTPSSFTHNLGYIPDVTVYQDDDCGNFEEIDTIVTNTTTTTSVDVSEGGVLLKVIIK